MPAIRPGDGRGMVYFNLDPLGRTRQLGAVGIDNYIALSDWRDADLSAGTPMGANLANDASAMRPQLPV